MPGWIDAGHFKPLALQLDSAQTESFNNSVLTPEVAYNSSPAPGHRKILPWFQRILDLTRILTWSRNFLQAWSANLQPPLTIERQPLISLDQITM